jgi:hypothetical protein
MNKNLLLAILVVSIIPALFILGQGLTGMVVNDTNVIAPVTAPAPASSDSLGITLFFTIAIIVLIIAIIYTIILFRTEKTAKKTSKKLELLNKVKAKFSKVGSTELTEDQIGRYIVAIVGVVAIVAILIMVLR